MSGFLDVPGPRWFTIPAHRPFLEDLAAGAWRALGSLGPEALAEAVVLLPTRRSARDLAEAFLKTAGARAMILPQVRALGDLEEGEPPFEAGDLALDLPPAISPLRRRFELAGLVAEHEGLLERRLDAGSALELADALAAFLDASQIEERDDPDAIDALVEGELARHWQLSAEFLKIATTHWPRRLEALGMMDVAARRVALMRRLAERWRDHPPNEVMIAAGSTGSAPAGADLLAAVAAAPRGAVVLPGLDTDLAEEAWREVGESHPQGTMKRLLTRAGLERGAVRTWDVGAPPSAAGRWRRRLINEALRPPDSTADWLTQIDRLREEGQADGGDPIALGLEGLTVVTARAEEEAATIVALLLREVLETPGKTAALITPDEALARRVSARLTRWAITADSSSGQPLAAAPAAVLLSLLARLAADMMDPVALLAVLKHPLVRLGRASGALGGPGWTLERYGLRGPRPDSWEAVAERLRAREDRIEVDGALVLIEDFRGVLERLRTPYDADGVGRPEQAARALIQVAETLAADRRGKTGQLWGGQAGEPLGALLAALVEDGGVLPDVSPMGFADLLDGLLARETVRPGGASHPRLRILGVLEGRMLRADRVILAGLEEGSWPAAAKVDPFLSRPMRERLGLPAPERLIGLSAHDFAQAACAPEVYLLHSDRSAGSPAVASRWLWRLRTLAKGAGLDLPTRPELVAWARGLDAPLTDPPPSLKTASRPSPRPPVAARPRELPVTAVELWLRNPYGLYVRYILGLRRLDRPDEPVDHLARGTAIHRAFERFSEAHPDDLPEDAEAVFASVLIDELRRAGMPAARMQRERALAANVAPWVIDFERKRRPGAELLVEAQGKLEFAAPGGVFKVTARADRIERRGKVGDVIDFKTGAAPSQKQVEAGVAPQLTLTGAILGVGGFDGARLAAGGVLDAGPLQPNELVYVRVNGGRTPGRVESRGGKDVDALVADILAGLKRRVAKFDIEATPYSAWVMPQFIRPQGGEHDHVARMWEWHVVGDGPTEGET